MRSKRIRMIAAVLSVVAAVTAVASSAAQRPVSPGINGLPAVQRVGKVVQPAPTVVPKVNRCDVANPPHDCRRPNPKH